jgi:hypothetical protein
MILDQLPNEKIVSIYKDFLFKEFLKTFRKMFKFHNFTSKNKMSFFDWHHGIYQEFMLTFLKHLNPIRYDSDTIIYNELDDIGTVTFVMSGFYKIGFCVNNKEHYFL